MYFWVSNYLTFQKGIEDGRWDPIVIAALTLICVHYMLYPATTLLLLLLRWDCSHLPFHRLRFRIEMPPPIYPFHVGVYPLWGNNKMFIGLIYSSVGMNFHRTQKNFRWRQQPTRRRKNVQDISLTLEHVCANRTSLVYQEQADIPIQFQIST